MSKNQIRLTITLAAVIIIALGYTVFFREPEPEETGKIKIAASFYPLAYLAEQIGGEDVEVTSIIPPGSEAHSWQPSINDIAEVEDADIVIYLGAGLDSWVPEDILGSVNTENKVILVASQGVTLLPASEEEHEEEEEGHSHGEYDPHMWLSPYVAGELADNIYTALAEADPEHAEAYVERRDTLKAKLSALDERYAEGLAAAAGKTFFTTHAAFGYVADRYGLKQRAVIGLSADEQPSTETLASIADAMIKEECRVIYVNPVYSRSYADTLKAEVENRIGGEVKILNLYLLLGPSDDLDYLQQMEANLESLVAGMTEQN
jgi:zinc transport system substrate-binding protein